MKIKEERRSQYASSSGYRTMFSYDAFIGPPAQFKLDGWTAMPIDREKMLPTARSDFDEYIPAHRGPVVYAIANAPGAMNEKGLRELWGDISIIYVDTYKDGTVFRCRINPRAERIEKTWNGLYWLPATVPLDVVTLPVQALWGALFVVAFAAEK